MSAHHAHHQFDLLPSGHCYRSMRSHISKLKNNFFPGHPNSKHPLIISLLIGTLHLHIILTFYSYNLILCVLLFYRPMNCCCHTIHSLIAPAFTIKSLNLESPRQEFKNPTLTVNDWFCGLTDGHEILSDISYDVERLMMHLCGLIRAD